MDDATTQEFEYDELSDDPFAIRLMMFERVERFEAPMLLKASKHVLSSSPRYWALSYTWDRPSDEFPESWDEPHCTKSILVNGKSFPVRMNLWFALHRLRAHWPWDKFWWIDAICINQVNLPEKNMVVPRMAKIYSCSECTFVWLGEGDTRTPSAFQYISDLSTSWEERSDKLNTHNLPDSHHAEYIDRLEKEFPEDFAEWFWDAIGTIWRRSWWHRSWIVQEIALSHATILMCGDRKVGWSQICNVVEVILQHADGLRRVEHPLKYQAQRLVEQFITAYEPFANLNYAMQMYTEKTQLDERPDLLPLMECIRQTKCKDPRDKLHSALGMSANGLRIQVDYTLSTEEIYTNLACLSISRNQDLNILSYCSSSPGPVKVPSWVPDWTVPDNRTSLGIPQRGIRGLGTAIPREMPFYSPCPKLNLSVRFQADSKVLVVRALPLDEIAFVSSNKGKGEASTPGGDQEWLREWAEFQHKRPTIFEWIRREGWQYCAMNHKEQFNQPTYLPTNEPLLESYFRTLSANVIFDLQSNLEIQIPENSDGFVAMDILMDSLSLRSVDRKLAISNKGILILAPSATEPEDMFTMIAGYEIPLILRKVDDNY